MALTFGAVGTDRVALAAGLDNLNAFTVLMWHYPTTVTAGRRFWHKGIGDAKSVLWGFGANVGPSLSVTRATTNLFVESNKTYATSKWWYSAFTFDTTDGGRVFSGDLTTTVAEDSYGSRNNGAGAVNDDSGGEWIIGTNKDLNQVYQGRVAVIAHFRRRMSLQEIIAWQYRPYTDADCDIFMQLGWNGTGTQPNLTSLGNAINGAVTGATVADHVPLALAPSAAWVPTRVIGVTATPAAATAAGSALAPIVLVTAQAAATAGLGATVAPVIAVRVNGTAATAAGSAPPAAPGQTATPAAATATGATSAPQTRILIPAAAAIALGLAPSPTVLTGALVVPAAVTVTDDGQTIILITDPIDTTVTVTMADIAP